MAKEALKLIPRFNSGAPGLTLQTARGTSILLEKGEVRELIEKLPSVSARFVAPASVALQRRVADAFFDAIRGLKSGENKIDTFRASELAWAAKQLVPDDAELHASIEEVLNKKETG